MSRNNQPHLSLRSSILAGVVLMFAMPVSAQAASYTYINQKAPYQNAGLGFPSPMLTALNLPKIGTTFQVQVPGNCSFSMCLGFGSSCEQQIPVTFQYVLAFGVSNPNVPVAMLGGFLYSSAEVRVPAPYTFSPWGFVKMSFPIPNSPQLVGVRFYQQVLGMTYSYGPPRYALSRGGHGVIGK